RSDAELAQDARAVVGVERREQELLVPVGGGLDDAPAAEDEACALDLVPGPRGRVLAERDHALRRFLDRAVEDLAAGDVRAGAVVDQALPPGEAEREVGAGPDDAYRLGAVEALRDRGEPFAQRAVVDQDGAEEELGERLDAHPGRLRQRRRRVLAA